MVENDMLDVLGSRWTLRILLALADRPMRFTDLRRALPAISAKVLAARLGELQRAALVARLPLPPPVSGRAYALAEEAEDLRRALAAIGRWVSARAPIAVTAAPC